MGVLVAIVIIGLGVGSYFLFSGEASAVPESNSTPATQQEIAEATTGDSAGMKAVAEAAKKYIGYEYGDRNESGKMDCSGLLWQAAKDVGINIPATANTQWGVASEVDEPTCRTTPGDLVFFLEGQVATHVEMSLGNGTSIGAWVSGGIGIHAWGWWESGDTRTIAYGRIVPGSGAQT